MAEFKVGGKVICVKDHSQLTVRRGQIFSLLDIRKSSCKCDDIELDIGIRVDKAYYGFNGECGQCQTVFYDPSEVGWLSSRNFIPLDDFKEVTFTELNKEMPVSAQ